jgi:hypothetical protein
MSTANNYDTFMEILPRIRVANPSASDELDNVDNLVRHGELTLAVEFALDLLAEGSIDVLFSEFCLMMQIMGYVKSTRYVWIDFAPKEAILQK